MAIFTRFGSKVVLESARLVPIWTTLGNIGNGVELKWHYEEPKRTSKWRKDVKVEGPMSIWHVTARYDDDRPGHGGTSPIEGERDLSSLVADEGLAEILAECRRLNPTDAETERQAFAA